MNNDRTTPEADDQDLSRLFDAQLDRVPEALDALILTAAKEAVAEPVATPKIRRGTVMKSWFAVAATVLLGITIAPLLLQTPESALDQAASTVATSDAVGVSVSMTAERSEFKLQNSESAIAEFAIGDEAPKSIYSPVMPAINAQSRAAADSGAMAGRQKRVSDGGEYRRTPKRWLEYIRTLIDDQQPVKARSEYELFREKYANYAPDFAPDFTLGAKPE